jgi:hypothetical protein
MTLHLHAPLVRSMTQTRKMAVRRVTRGRRSGA